MICFLAFLASCVWMTLEDKPIPDQVLWGTGMFFGVDVINKQMKRKDGDGVDAPSS